ncbi:MAG TPA: ABC transporter substrate-binding protein [Geminicoccaceae bacterium]|nr:ABC transporter substrate-binding protein [Geminicoccaceae bacterium]
MAKIRILFSRYSAFYSPLVATQAGGFLAAEGLEAEFAVAGAGAPPRARLKDGSIDLIQSAPSASWGPLERGEDSEIVHFALINQRDGFFLAGRRPDPEFAWRKLEGARVLVDHGAQPLAMFKYALHEQGVNYARLEAVDAGAPEAMVAAFRAGQGDYIHLQGPAPQQLEQDGVAHVVAAVGATFGPVAFSSLCATRSWLATDLAKAFMRAYAKARKWVASEPPAAVAKAEARFFQGVDEAVLARTIAAYQRLGCWQGPLEIPRDAYEVALDVFQHGGLITRRPPYDAVVVPPPVS